MQYVVFGNTGMLVSRFTLGGMTLGTRFEPDQATQVIDEAIDHGVNFIDTADSYRDSEECIGRALTPEKRDKVFLATKVFRTFCRNGKVGRNSRVNIINSLERSLKVLKTDYVDLYQLHHPDEQTPVEETLSTLDQMVKQGKIRYVGVSNHYAWQMALMLGESKANHWESIVSFQASYSILDRQIEMESLPFCTKLNIAIMCYGPLCGGILTGKYQGLKEIPEDSRAAGNRRTRDYLETADVRKIVERLEEIARDNDLKLNQLAILWLLGKSHATTVILGGSKSEHFTQIYEIADRTLPECVVKEIDDLSSCRIYCPFANQPFRMGPGLRKTF